MFPVFTRSGEVTVSINILSREVALKKEELDKLKIFHMFLFSNVLRLEKDPMDFFPDCSTMGFLVVPLNKEGNGSISTVFINFCNCIILGFSSSLHYV
jgi:endoribonuclease Dicer